MDIMQRALAVTLALLGSWASGAGPVAQYNNVQADLGLDFVLAGAIDADGNDREWPGFPEIMGGGACWADFDGDGYDDLYVVNQQFNPESPAAGPWLDTVDPHSALYLYDGDGTFTDFTVEAHVEGRHFSYGCSAADYDGDGDVDLFVSAFGDARWGGNQLFRNRGPAIFEDVSDAAGVSMLGACGAHPCFSTSSAWVDYDGDGDLDLYVANYVDTALDDGERGPGNHTAQLNFLHRNNGDGTFTNVAEQAGVQGTPEDFDGSKSLGVVWFDYDLDGDLDLFVANDQTPDDFYENHGDGTFVERSEDAGLDDWRAGMGVATGDYDGDGLPDIIITHYSAQENGFYRNRGDGTFEDRSGEDDLHESFPYVGWGVAWVDLDRDGDLDLFVANGHTEYHLEDLSPMPSQAFLQGPNPDEEAAPWDRIWVDASEDMGPGVVEERITRGAAFSDHDLDGDTDIALVNNENDTIQFLQATEQENHFLNVRLLQPGMNRHAIGAKLKLEVADLLPQYREVQAGSSYLSQNTLQQEFGLGEHTVADRLTITWPDGGTTVVLDLAGDRTIRVDRPTGAVASDVLAPRTTVHLVGVAGVEGWYRSDVTATISAVDRGAPDVSGLASTEHAIADGGWLPYTGQSYTFIDEGVVDVHARSTDVSGLVEPRRTTHVKIDRAAPAATHALDGTLGQGGWWVAEPVRVALAGEDDWSGVHELRYRIDGDAWQVYDEPILVDEDGVHLVEYLAVDKAGNEGAIGTVEVRLDRAGPVASLASPAAGAIYLGGQELAGSGPGPTIIVVPPAESDLPTTITVVVIAEDVVSGVDRVAFFIDGSLLAVDREGPDFTWDWPLLETAVGPHELEVVVVDEAGNLSVTDRDVLVLGTTLEGEA